MKEFVVHQETYDPSNRFVERPTLPSVDTDAWRTVFAELAVELRAELADAEELLREAESDVVVATNEEDAARIARAAYLEALQKLDASSRSATIIRDRIHELKKKAGSIVRTTGTLQFRRERAAELHAELRRLERMLAPPDEEQAEAADEAGA